MANSGDPVTMEDFDIQLGRTAHLAFPYELIAETDETAGIVRLLMVAKLPNGMKAASHIDVAVVNVPRIFLGSSLVQLIKDLKSNIRETLAGSYTDQKEREMRLWLAESLDLDRIFFTKDIPPSYVKKYEESKEAAQKRRVLERQLRLREKTKEQEEKQRRAFQEAVMEETAVRSGKTKASLQGIARRPVTPKRAPKTPRCPVHDVPMEYDAMADLWRCKQPRKDNASLGCNLTAVPKQSRRENELVIGQGRIVLQVIVDPDKPNAKPQFLLVASNNVAIDVSNLEEFAFSRTHTIKTIVARMGEDAVDMKTFRIGAVFSYENSTFSGGFSGTAEALQIVLRKSG